MPTDGAALLAGYRRLDAAVAAVTHGHATSKPWLETLERFWLSGKRRLVIRKGRQGGGSTTFARVAVATALFGQHRPAHGTRLSIPFVSVRKDEARDRLGNIEAILDALGEPFNRRDERIELQRLPVSFIVYPCSARTAVGPTSAAVFEDEVAMWWSDDWAANPAAEVDSALIPSLITQPNGRVYTGSSPRGLDDFHAQLVARGETPEQCVAEGPSWYWNPAITEAASRELQPDERAWKREFAAIPQGDALSAFDAQYVDESLTPLPYEYHEVSNRIYCIDAAASGDCEYVGAEAVWVQKTVREADYWVMKPALHNSGPLIGTPNGKFCCDRDEFGGLKLNPEAMDLPPSVLCIRRMWAVHAKRTTIDALHDRIAYECHTRGVSLCTGDQFESYSNLGGLARRGIPFVERKWGAVNKPAAITMLRRLMTDGRLLLLPDASDDDKAIMRRQLLGYQERFSGSHVAYKSRAGLLSDRASILIVAAIAAQASEDKPSLFGEGDVLALPPPNRSGPAPDDYRSNMAPSGKMHVSR